MSADAGRSATRYAFLKGIAVGFGAIAVVFVLLGRGHLVLSPWVARVSRYVSQAFSVRHGRGTSLLIHTTSTASQQADGTGSGQNVASVPAVGPGDHVRGSMQAPVTLIEYADFQDAHTMALDPMLAQLIEIHPNDVRLLYRHFPIPVLDPEALSAAEASECAAVQGGDAAFWSMHDALLTPTHQAFSTSTYVAIASMIKLSTTAFQSCLQTQQTRDLVLTQMASANDIGVHATPTIYINGALYQGDKTPAGLEQAIQAALAGHE